MVEILAHEMCHAYAHSLWNQFYVAASMQKGGLREKMFEIDEGIASELAQQVLDDWFIAKPAKGVPRPSVVPRGRVGYLPTIGTRAIGWVGTIENNLGTASSNTFRMYFAGDMEFTLDEDAPLTSDVRCGGDRHRALNDLL